jgi:hypothetical protein
MVDFDSFLINGKLTNYYKENKILHYVPPVFYGLRKNLNILPAVKGMTYTRYAFNINNATVFGSSNIIVCNKQILYDLPFYDISGKYRYTDSKIIKISNRKKAIYWKGKKHQINRAVWMGGNYSWNYYHLMFEFAIKFLNLNKLNIPLDVPVLVDEICFDVPQYKELINIMNTQRRMLVSASKTGRYNIRNLYYVNCPSFIPPNLVNDNTITADDVQFDMEMLSELRTFLLPYSSERKFPAKIFISRKKTTSGRRPFNEDEVIDLCSQFGFETVSPEEFSFRDQIALFNQAQYIIGGSGAAFTNLLFCNRNCKAIIFTKTRLPFSGFSTPAHIAEVDLKYITEKNSDNISCNLHDRFEIDINCLKQQLSDWIV